MNHVEPASPSPKRHENDSATRPRLRNRIFTAGFTASTTGVRDIELKERGFKRILRYLPLMGLMLAVIAATGIGLWYSATHCEIGKTTNRTPRVNTNATANTTKALAPLAPAPCLPSIPQPQPSHFAGTAGTGATETFITHATTSPYVIGRDNWVFWVDAQAHNFSQAIGKEQLSAAKLAEWGKFFTNLRTLANARGATLVIMPGPAKWDVFARFLPEWTEQLLSDKPLNQLIRAYPQLPWLDTRETVSAKAPVEPKTPDTFYGWSRVNSHWSPYGGYLAWKQTVKCLAALDSQLQGLTVPPVAQLRVTQAPNEFLPLGYHQQANDWVVPAFSLQPGTFTATDQNGNSLTLPVGSGTDFANLPTETRNPHATGPAALIFRDSMGNGISPLWNLAFSRTYQMGHYLDTGHPTDFATAIATQKPRVIIFEFAERYLTFTPPPLPHPSANTSKPTKAD